ncbi:MAG: M3 family oligoendopeptidase [Deltaproteobacteria bacterium]|jgi:oligoendopeptidase F|nr:M3 family oligoendopeptidase [Deltaproteobacteria bacterium]
MSQSPKWDLGRLYAPDSLELKQDMELIRRRRTEFAANRELLVNDKLTLERFAALVRELESLRILDSQISGFAELSFSDNTSDEKAQAFLGVTRQASAELENELLFFELWWQKLDPALADEYRASLPEFDYFLTQIRALLEHSLAEGEERVINLKNANGRQAIITLYDSITNRYVFDSSFIPGSDGQPIGREELMVQVRSHQPRLREKAYQELYRVFSDDGPALGQIYQALVRDWRQENVRLRHYGSPISVRHKFNDLPQETVDSLLRVCQGKGRQVFGRYFQKKAQALGMSKLRRYDLYAPLSEEKRQWTFAEAMDEVTKCFGDFDPQLAQLAQNIVSQNHLDAQIRQGKASGAFCASLAPKMTPWVLMTFKGQTQDVFTLAHELGHAAHSQLAKDQNLFQFHACLPLAETASTFGELLLAKRLLANADPADREALTFHLLDDAYATVGRQAFFALFEITAHEMIEEGASVSQICQSYWDNLVTQFGDSLALNEEFRWEWVTIPHIFHTPFYVYAYSFGQLLVYSLWRVYEREGPDLAQRLMKLLARGGSAPPLTILAEAGLGPLDDDFWLGGFEVIDALMSGTGLSG